MAEYYNHKCKCGCEKQIEIKPHHKYYGVPLYISGHNSINLKGKPSKLKGRVLTKEHKHKISLSNKGNTSWIKGKHHTEKTKQKISLSNKGVKRTYKNGLSPNIGIKRTKTQLSKRTETRRKNGWFKNPNKHKKRISMAISGEKVFNGFKTSENHRIRKSPKYIEWREKVFERDNWTCQNCKMRGGILNAHHIKGFAKYKDLRFDINNGITYCKKCHIKLDKYLGKKLFKGEKYTK